MGASWQQWALVMAGGALGAAGRFWLGGSLIRQFGERMPWGTLAANFIGAFAIGFLAEFLLERGQAAMYWRAFLMIGLLGALTTYSSVMLELLVLTRNGRTGAAALYLGITLVGGMLLVWAGARFGALFR
ncbi:MAG: CrcB family protein [Xanthomonadaceae bacterium]|nr:CrcB family protein [Xanthomonadaceae bacterium]